MTNTTLGVPKPLHPPPSVIFSLWQIFSDNVDPLLKIFHQPTIQQRISEAIHNLSALEPSMEALMFSIYYAAITSLSAKIVLSMFGENREDILTRFQRGLEVSIHMAGFLDSPTITSLQAMSIYLVRGLSITIIFIRNIV